MNSIEKKVDLMALRKLYEKRGNQDKLDKLTMMIFEKFSVGERKEMLAGVRVSQELVDSLDLDKLIELIFLGAYPKSILTSGIMCVDSILYNFEKYDELFRHDFIGIGDLQKVVLGATGVIPLLKTSMPRWVCNFCKMLQKDDLSIYAGFDFEEAIEKFIYYLYSLNINPDNSKTVFQACCNILKKLPYNEERNSKISRKILNVVHYECNAESNSMYLVSTLEEILNGKTIMEIIELLSIRQDLTSIFINDKACKRILAASINIEELFNLMIQDKIGPIGLMFALFDDIYERGAEILNSWIAQDLELPIDIYLEDIINYSIRVKYKDLDEKHMGALEEEKGKKFEMHKKEACGNFKEGKRKTARNTQGKDVSLI